MSKNNSLIQKGDVVWVQYRKDPLWPALVQTVYPNKKVTYSFFPLPKDGKKPPLFSCQPNVHIQVSGARESGQGLPLVVIGSRLSRPRQDYAMYALKRTDSLPLDAHHRDDMKDAFRAAVEHMNDKKMDIGSKAPLAPHRHDVEAALEDHGGKAVCEQLPTTTKGEPTTAEAETTTTNVQAVVPLRNQVKQTARASATGVCNIAYAVKWPRSENHKHPRNIPKYLLKKNKQKPAKCEKPKEENQPTNIKASNIAEPGVILFSAQPSHNGNTDSGHLKDITEQKEDCADIKGISKTEGGGGPRSFKDTVFENINKILNELWTDVATTGYQIPPRKEIQITLPHSRFLSDDDADCLFEQIVTFVKDRENQCRLLPAILLTSDVLFPRVILRCIEIEKGIDHNEAKTFVEECNGIVGSGDETGKAPNTQISGLDALVRVACEARDKANGF